MDAGPGTVSVLGLDPGQDRAELTQRFGLQLQDSQLPDRLRVDEVLELYSSFYRNPADWRALIDVLGLAGKIRARFGKLLGGQEQRLSIALALVGTRSCGQARDRPAPIGPAAKMHNHEHVTSGAIPAIANNSSWNASAAHQDWAIFVR